jgi:hypothetical protein
VSKNRFLLKATNLIPTFEPNGTQPAPDDNLGALNNKGAVELSKNTQLG